MLLYDQISKIKTLFQQFAIWVQPFSTTKKNSSLLLRRGILPSWFMSVSFLVFYITYFMFSICISNSIAIYSSLPIVSADSIFATEIVKLSP